MQALGLWLRWPNGSVLDIGDYFCVAVVNFRADKGIGFCKPLSGCGIH